MKSYPARTGRTNTMRWTPSSLSCRTKPQTCAVAAACRMGRIRDLSKHHSHPPQPPQRRHAHSPSESAKSSEQAELRRARSIPLPARPGRGGGPPPPPPPRARAAPQARAYRRGGGMRLMVTKSSARLSSVCARSTRLRASPIAVTSSGVSMMYCVSGCCAA